MSVQRRGRALNHNGAMAGLLEVLALHEADARRAEEGGADRVVVWGSLDDNGHSPTPDLVARVRDMTTLQVRVLLRLRDGFGTDGGEITRLIGLASSYADAGADGMVLGFVNGIGQLDVEVARAITADATWPFTFDDAFDHALSPTKAWDALRDLPRLDQVLTSGSPRGVEAGLDDLLAQAKSDPRIAELIMAGRGLEPEHVPWLVRAGVRAFHVGPQVREKGSFASYVDAGLVDSWRDLIDSTIAHVTR